MQHKVASDWDARTRIDGVGAPQASTSLPDGPAALAALPARPFLEITPSIAGWKYLSFASYSLPRGRPVDGESGADELCIVLLSGSVTFEAAGRSWHCDGRRSVFEGLPFAVYLPPGHRYRMTAQSDTDYAVARAQAEGRFAPRLITPDDVRVEIRGGHNVTRQITHILDPGEAEKLLCVEVYTPSGNWSSYPPHKHDAHRPPLEVDLEEVYYYRINPPDGWAMQRLYTDDRAIDDVVLAQHGDAVMVRQGYHPVVAAPGYDVYYLNFLAGDTPSWAASDDPQLAWVRGSWEGGPERMRLPIGSRRLQQ